MTEREGRRRRGKPPTARGRKEGAAGGRKDLTGGPHLSVRGEGERRRDWAAWAEREAGRAGKKRKKGGREERWAVGRMGKGKGFGVCFFLFQILFKQFFKPLFKSNLLQLFTTFSQIILKTFKATQQQNSCIST
jgi:hypothetical protein